MWSTSPNLLRERLLQHYPTSASTEMPQGMRDILNGETNPHKQVTVVQGTPCCSCFGAACFFPCACTWCGACRSRSSRTLRKREESDDLSAFEDAWYTKLFSFTKTAFCGKSPTLTVFMLFLAIVLAIVGGALQASFDANIDSDAVSSLRVKINNEHVLIWDLLYAVATALCVIPFAHAANFILLGTLRQMLFSRLFIVVLYLGAFDNGPLTVILWAIGANEVTVRLSGLPDLGQLAPRVLVLFIVCGLVTGLKNLMVAVLQGRTILDQFTAKVRGAVQKLVVLQNLSAAAVTVAAKRAKLLQRFHSAQMRAIEAAEDNESGDFELEVPSGPESVNGQSETRPGSGTAASGDNLSGESSRASLTQMGKSRRRVDSQQLLGIAGHDAGAAELHASIAESASRARAGSGVSSLSMAAPLLQVAPAAAVVAGLQHNSAAGSSGVGPSLAHAVSSMPATALSALPPLNTSGPTPRHTPTLSGAQAPGKLNGDENSAVLAVVGDNGLLSTVPLDAPSDASSIAHGRSSRAGTLSPVLRRQRGISMTVALQPNLSVASRNLFSRDAALSAAASPEKGGAGSPRGRSGSEASRGGGAIASRRGRGLTTIDSVVEGEDEGDDEGATTSIKSNTGNTVSPARPPAPPAGEQAQVHLEHGHSDRSMTSSEEPDAEDLRDFNVEDDNYAVLSKYIEAGQFSLFDGKGRIVAIRNAAHAKRLINQLFTALDTRNTGLITRQQLQWDGDGWNNPLGPGWSEDSIEAAFQTMGADNALSFSRSDLLLFTEAAVTGFQSLRGTLNSLSAVTRALSLLANVLLMIVFIIFGVLLFDIDVQPVLISIGTVLVSVSFAIAGPAGNFVESLIFLLVTRPYDMGDRVRFNGGITMFVHKMDLYTTTFERNDGTYVTYRNAVLAAGEIRNEKRSGYATIQVQMDISMDATPEQLEAMNGAVVNYVRNRPQSWRSGVIEFHIYSLNPERNSMSVAFWLRHRHPFQNGTAVFGDTSLFLLFVSRLFKKMGIRYSLPKQPIEILGQRGVDIMGDDDLSAPERLKAEKVRSEGRSQALHADEAMPSPEGSKKKSKLSSISSRRSKRYNWSDSESEDEDATDHANHDAVRRLAAAESTSHHYQDIKMGSIAQIWRDEQRVHVPVAPPLGDEDAWDPEQMPGAPAVALDQPDIAVEEGGASPDQPDAVASNSDLMPGVQNTRDSGDFFIGGSEGRRLSHGQANKRSSSPFSETGDLPPGLEMRSRPLSAEHRNNSWDSMRSAQVFGPAPRPKGLDLKHNVGQFGGISLGDTTPKPQARPQGRPGQPPSRSAVYGPQPRPSTSGEAAAAATGRAPSAQKRSSTTGVSRSSSFGHAEPAAADTGGAAKDGRRKQGISRSGSDRAKRQDKAHG